MSKTAGRSEYNFFIGIDPNYSENEDQNRLGVATGRRGEGLETVKKMFLGDLLDIIEAAPADTLIRIETPSETVHGAAASGFALYAKTAGGHKAKIATVARVFSKRGAALGRLREQSKMIAAIARRAGLAVEMVPDDRRRRCDKAPRSLLNAKQIREARPSKRFYLSKLDARRFSALTGWDRRTCEDGRDAALLIFFDL